MRIAALAGLLLACVYLLTARGRIDTEEGRVRLDVARAIYDEGRPGLDERLDLRWVTIPGRHAPRVTCDALGPTLLGLPFLYTARRLFGPNGDIEEFAFMLSGPLCAAVAAMLYGLLLALLGCRRKVVLAATLIVGLCSSLWPVGQSSSEESQVSVLLLLLAIAVVWRAGSAVLPCVLAGAATGCLLLMREGAVLCALPLLVALYRKLPGPRRARVRPVLYLLGSALPFVLIYCGYNEWRYGSLLSVSGRLQLLHELGIPLFGNPVRALYGLLLSPGKGLLFHVPVIPLSLLYWSWVQERDRALGWAVPATLIVALLLLAPFKLWHGDPAWGPRHLLGLVPLLLLGLPGLMEIPPGVASRPARRAALAVVLASGMVQLCAIAVPVEGYFLLRDRGYVSVPRDREPTLSAEGSQLAYHFTEMPRVVIGTVLRLYFLDPPRWVPGIVPVRKDRTMELDHTQRDDTLPFYWAYFDTASSSLLRTPLYLSAGILAALGILALLLLLRAAREPNRGQAHESGDS